MKVVATGGRAPLVRLSERTGAGHYDDDTTSDTVFSIQFIKCTKDAAVGSPRIMQDKTIGPNETDIDICLEVSRLNGPHYTLQKAFIEGRVIVNRNSRVVHLLSICASSKTSPAEYLEYCKNCLRTPTIKAAINQW